MTRIPLWLAAHEAGHAVARLAIDEWLPFPGPMIKHITLGADAPSDDLGVVWMDARRVLLPHGHQRDTRGEALVRLDIIETFAGPIAEFMARHSIIGMRIRAELWLEDLTSEDSLGVVRHPRGDDAAILRRLDWLSVDDRRDELCQLYDVAFAIVYAEWPGVRKIAKSLRLSGDVDGQAFEDAWRVVRPNRRKRSRRLSYGSCSDPEMAVRQMTTALNPVGVVVDNIGSQN